MKKVIFTFLCAGTLLFSVPFVQSSLPVQPVECVDKNKVINELEETLKTKKITSYRQLKKFREALVAEVSALITKKNTKIDDRQVLSKFAIQIEALDVKLGTAWSNIKRKIVYGLIVVASVASLSSLVYFINENRDAVFARCGDLKNFIQNKAQAVSSWFRNKWQRKGGLLSEGGLLPVDQKINTQYPRFMNENPYSFTAFTRIFGFTKDSSYSRESFNLHYYRLIKMYHPDNYPNPDDKRVVTKVAAFINNTYEYLRDRFYPSKNSFFHENTSSQPIILNALPSN